MLRRACHVCLLKDRQANARVADARVRGLPQLVPYLCCSALFFSLCLPTLFLPSDNSSAYYSRPAAQHTSHTLCTPYLPARPYLNCVSTSRLYVGSLHIFLPLMVRHLCLYGGTLTSQSPLMSPSPYVYLYSRHAFPGSLSSMLFYSSFSLYSLCLTNSIYVFSVLTLLLCPIHRHFAFQL